MSTTFDIIVVGAGHAGCEAAAAAARVGRRVAMVTFHREHIGRLSCNPAIGGIAKGCLVRELDALGGLMAKVADATTVQFRRLNTRKGLAVRSSRAQVDTLQYPREMQRRLDAIAGLEIVEGEALGLLLRGGKVAGVRLADRQLWAGAVILTTGTFLGGLLHRGKERQKGGRIEDGAAHALSKELSALGLRLGRLKTGTPPRLCASSVDWSRLKEQPHTDGCFSFTPPARRLPPLSCWIAHTNDRTHDIIRHNLASSAMYSGAIKGSGPRHCPSIEDKIARFPDRKRHQLFLEPESHDSERVYVNGLSTSLPVEVQLAAVRSIPGLEDAEVLQWGYAVEYDFNDPRDLAHDLQHREVPGLYLAGQVNGTSGYEEAGIQGLLAGLAAAGSPLRLGREQAYAGVLVDDLVTRGVGGEPYRMFSSRAEHRLILREDNADRRLMPLGREAGLVEDTEWRAFEARSRAIAHGLERLESARLVPDAQGRARIEAAGLGTIRTPATGFELMRRPKASWRRLAEVIDLPALPPEVAEQVETDVKYAGYIRREEARAAQARRLGRVRLDDVDFSTIPGLSNEARERLLRARPENLQSASRLPGVTPAAVNTLAAHLSRKR
ncbi:MAG TPA: tRNA uridine-5-carboxymethylaminomethyl(34) synthesis enzyme MnmG [Myxococcota bacterium]|nr:tRNA uridine-5-carboxymethylaminomethyl(34) synthesis enzyme MnmG [Myxococcota bacterium]